jgi:glyoxylase-like metal-dependent hydrolase (beta-lactamase superfamily II)
MAKIPLEDNYNDILGKAARGLGLAPAALAQAAGASPEAVASLLDGRFDEALARKLAPVLGLAEEPLVASGRGAWYPEAWGDFPGVKGFSTPFDDFHVNAYLVWDPASKQGVAFDTGADCAELLAFAQAEGLTIALILLTHTHPDHIMDLARLKAETGAPAHLSRLESLPGAEPIDAGASFSVGALRIQARQTVGHTRGGMSYYVTGLPQPLAAVGDAMFAGSMGGGNVSYQDALRTNRAELLSLPDETILLPGHGPLTTVGEQKRHNPFFPPM